MKFTTLAASAALALAPMAASAVTYIGIDPADAVSDTIPSGSGTGGFDLDTAVDSVTGTTGLYGTGSTVSVITGFNGTDVFDPLINILDSPVDVRFTYIGSEAGFKNFAVAFGGSAVFDNGGTFSEGDTATFLDVTGASPFALDFQYDTCPSSGCGPVSTISNLGDSDGENLYLAASEVFTSPAGWDAVVAYFGDGGGDDSGTTVASDYDDLVVMIEVIPLPAGVLLIGTAFAAAGVARRVTRKAA